MIKKIAFSLLYSASIVIAMNPPQPTMGSCGSNSSIEIEALREIYKANPHLVGLKKRIDEYDAAHLIEATQQDYTAAAETVEKLDVSPSQERVVVPSWNSSVAAKKNLRAFYADLYTKIKKEELLQGEFYE